MTHEEVDWLLREESRQTVLKYLDERPERLALRLGGGGALLATQLKYLQRARTKLPSYYRARCILPPLAFEQASSEAVAAEKRYGGALCIDLTCGLGVDSAHFSKSFDRVIAVERDPVTARVAAVNFSLLGISNIEVVNDSAEHFIESFPGTADLVYADPARRGEGNRKVFRFEECSPDIVSLLPAIREKTRRVVVKASPLFDIDEAFRLFGDRITVDIVSRQGECKEVLIDVPSAPDAPAGSVRAVAAGCGSLVFGRGTASRRRRRISSRRTGICWCRTCRFARPVWYGDTLPGSDATPYRRAVTACRGRRPTGSSAGSTRSARWHSISRKS